MTSTTQSPLATPNPEDLRRQSDAHLRRQLPALCRYERWTEWEAVSIFAGLPPTPPEDAPPYPRELLTEQVRRRDGVRRHLDDLIAAGKLQVKHELRYADLEAIPDEALRAGFKNAAYVNTAYGKRYTIEPAVAICCVLDLDLERRGDRFPDCPLTEEHRAIATKGRKASPEAESSRVAPAALPQMLKSDHHQDDSLARRAELIREWAGRFGKSGLGVDRGTVRKILNRAPVSEQTLEAIARHMKKAHNLNVSRTEIP